jgi:SNW domain-containing protein 1
MSPATSSLNAEHALREPSAQYQPQCIPSYGARNGTVPRLAAHFSSGGSFPEVHVAQFPPGLDLALLNALDAPDAVLECAPDNVAESHDTQALTKHSKHTTFLPTPHAVSSSLVSSFLFEMLRYSCMQVCARPTIDDTSAALIKTRASILGKIAKKDMHLKVHAKAQPEFVKYTPSMRRGDTTSEASHRVIKLHEVQSDPLDPPKFRHKKVTLQTVFEQELVLPLFYYKVPRGPGSPPAPIMHSPPRSTNAKEQVDWKVPPSISNWKVNFFCTRICIVGIYIHISQNPKGYTIPLDKRLAADGRGLQDVHINDNFAKLSEVLIPGCRGRVHNHNLYLFSQRRKN